MKSKIAIITTLAIKKLFTVTLWYFLKKYRNPIAGKANKAIK